MHTHRFQKGFTLVEIVIVVGILSVLLAISIVAINPARQFAQANNTKRRSDVNAILNAVSQYQTDNRGVLPTGITTTNTTIANTGVDICAALVSRYIASLPVDPLTNNGTPITSCAGTYTTNYMIVKSASNSRITVSAPNAELSDTISITR